MSRQRSTIFNRVLGVSMVALGLSATAYAALADYIGPRSARIEFGFLQFGGIFVGALVALAGILAFRGFFNPLLRSVARQLQATLIRIRRATATDLAVAFVATMAAFAAGEGAIRLTGVTDENGQFYFNRVPLRPYALPVTTTAQTLDAFLHSEEGDASYIIYDPDLGWTIRPGGRSLDGLYAANTDGLRAQRDYELDPEAGILRIAIFGDSFTHGSDVAFEDTWGQQLELMLRQDGIEAEVLNFGVGGYGIDQAYLRWQHQGYRYAPDIVVFGFQPTNIRRNLNLFRPFLNRFSETPLFKPRFVLEGNELRLVNSPTPQPDTIVSMIENFTDISLAEYEYFFDPDDYARRWWSNSRLLALTLETIRLSEVDESSDIYALGGEPSRLTLALVDAFQEDVETHGALFIIVHLPGEAEVRRTKRSAPLDYALLLDELDARHTLVRSGTELASASIDEHFAGHYTPEGNRVVAELLAAEIAKMVADGQFNDLSVTN